MNNLKPCPCGEVPNKILLNGASFQGLRQAFGDCCHYWRVEFKLNIKLPEETHITQAIDAWNAAPRGNE